MNIALVQTFNHLMKYIKILHYNYIKQIKPLEVQPLLPNNFLDHDSPFPFNQIRPVWT